MKRLSVKSDFLVSVFLVSILLTLSFSFAGNCIWLDPYLKKVDTTEVKRVEIEEYRFKDGSWEKVDTMTAVYGQQGHLLRESRHTAAGTLQFDSSYKYEGGNLTEVIAKRRRQGKIVNSRYVYSYDHRGNQIEGIGYAGDDSVISRHTAEYNKDNEVTQEMHYQSGNAVSKYIAEYDGDGNLVEEAKYKVYQYKGSDHYQQQYKYEYSYDSDSNLTKEVSYKEEDSIEYTHTYKYDENGNMVKGVKYAPDGSLKSRYEAEYQGGNLVQFVKYNSNEDITSHHEAVYNNDGERIKEYSYLGDKKVLIYAARYDADGNLLEEAHYSDESDDKDALEYKYVYEYDSHGNEVEETYYVYFEDLEKWKPISKQVNKITYL